MSRKLLISTSLLVLLVCIVTFFAIHYPRKSFNDLLGTHEGSITRVSVRSGGNGASIETDDKDKIERLIGLLNNRYYRKAINQDPRAEYNYFYEFHSEDKMVLRITGAGSKLNINGTCYKASKPISLDMLNYWFSSLLTVK